jgi:hypothetical protein
MGRYLPFVLVVVIFALALLRRMRPQPVRPQRLVVTAVIVVLLLGSSAVSSGTHLFRDVPALLLAPVALVAGCAVGFLLVHHTRFWTNEKDGQLWMAGGAVFAIILIVTIGLRVGLNLAAHAPNSSGAVATGGFLPDLATDLLFLSMGMWLTRASMVYLRWRRHQTAASTVAVGER